MIRDINIIIKISESSLLYLLKLPEMPEPSNRLNVLCAGQQAAVR